MGKGIGYNDPVLLNRILATIRSSDDKGAIICAWSGITNVGRILRSGRGWITSRKAPLPRCKIAVHRLGEIRKRMAYRRASGIPVIERSSGQMPYCDLFGN